MMWDVKYYVEILMLFKVLMLIVGPQLYIFLEIVFLVGPSIVQKKPNFNKLHRLLHITIMSNFRCKD